MFSLEFVTHQRWVTFKLVSLYKKTLTKRECFIVCDFDFLQPRALQLARSQVWAAGGWLLETGATCWRLAAGCWLLDVGCWTLVLLAGGWLLGLAASDWCCLLEAGAAS